MILTCEDARRVEALAREPRPISEVLAAAHPSTMTRSWGRGVLLGAAVAASAAQPPIAYRDTLMQFERARYEGRRKVWLRARSRRHEPAPARAVLPLP